MTILTLFNTNDLVISEKKPNFALVNDNLYQETKI